MTGLWRSRPLLISAFLLACALTLFFAGRFVAQAVYWPAHLEEPVRPWMTTGYVARSWGLDPRAIEALAGLPVPGVKGHPQPLSEIAEDRGVPVEEVIEAVEAAVGALRAADPGKGPNFPAAPRSGDAKDSSP